jgi:Fungalysin metallopeptidase (M36)/Fungalysin/Thermolysin Propeptide Motif
MKDPTQQLNDHLGNGAYAVSRNCGALSSWWKRGTQMSSPRHTFDFSKLTRLIPLTILFAVPVLLAQTSERQAPKAPPFSTLTGPSSRSAQDIGASYLASSSGLASEDLSSIYLAKEYKNVHNGVTHLVYRQRFQGIEVENAAWVTNIGRDGAVLSAGGALFAAPGVINFGNQISADIAVRAAAREVNPRLATAYEPLKMPAKLADTARANSTAYAVRYAAGGFGADIEGRLVWYAHRGTLLLAWVFNMVDEDGASSYDVAVEAATGAIIEKKPTSFFQSAPQGLIFDKGSPQPNPMPGVRLNAPPPFVEREAVPLSGDLVASPMGWILNSETAGFNAIVSENLLGQTFLPNPRPTQTVNGSFFFPLSLGPTAPNPLAFPDAANVNLFYWVNRAHDLFYASGFDEAAGNFQSDNYGRGGLGGDAMLAYTHYGSAAPASPALNNAFFTTRSTNDGAASMIAMFATVSGPGGFFSDGAYASEVIVHEYTHGVSLRLLPDGYGSFQTGAMGEAWSDFFSLDFTVPDGSPTDGSYPVGEYWNQSWGTGIRTRPYSTDPKINPLTYADLGHVTFGGPEVHADGEIWVEALWDARANLIQQFGEIEGRRRIRQLVLDGMTLAVPSPTMIEARDAILLADRVDFEGASRDQLWNAFAKRGMGALAHSDGGDTVHIVSSFDVPTPEGKLQLYEKTYVAGEPIRVILSDSNLSQPTARVQIQTTAGDQEDLILRRNGSIYFGLIPSSIAVVTRRNGIVNIVPGDTITASYHDDDAGTPVGSAADASATIEATAATQQPYALVTPSPTTGLPSFPNETRLTNVRAPVTVNLPFEFPFFSKKYRSMVVFPTGAIGFEPSVFTNLFRPGCNDVAELSRIAAIAPLFSNLTFGTAQQNEGVFISTPAANSVAIRWTAETLGGAEPVNFAATMNSDGVVTFYYGAGNQNFQSALQTLSTCGAQPAVGISNGHDVYARTISRTSYNNVTPIALHPPFGSATTPEVILERPAPEDTVRGVLRISGIAYEPGLANQIFISRRDVFIDDVERAVATTLVSRPDYCAINAVPGCPLVGFQADLNLEPLGLTPGSHSMRIRVTNTRAAFKDSAPVTFNVDAGQSRLPKGAIEAPAPGAELSGTSVDVHGYAYADDLRVNRVDLLIDGVTYPGITYGVARPDICGPLPAPAPPNCPAVGWTLTLNTRSGSVPLPDGAHTMQLRVMDETGRFSLLPDQPIPFTVNNGPQAFPVGAVTSIKPNDRLSGIVAVSGYAYSPGGRVIAVLLLTDGTAIAVAQYGLPRPDECAALPDVTACPNIGFSVNLDTRTLTNGDHVIGVRILNDAGLGVTVPDQVRGGMNVVIDNP